MINILLQTVVNNTHINVSKLEKVVTILFNWTLIIGASLIILLVCFVLWKKRKCKPELGFEKIKKSKSEKIDMENLFDSLAYSKELYKKMTKKCHPDKFLDIQQNRVADEIFQEITKNQRNFKKLVELKKLAETKLNITI